MHSAVHLQCLHSIAHAICNLAVVCWGVLWYAWPQEVVKGMIARNKGHIVNMSSIAGKEAYHGATRPTQAISSA
jgi:NAD(P)-dependent dehydrogenase (short-subunit alcohol dehydrogenase family)